MLNLRLGGNALLTELMLADLAMLGAKVYMVHRVYRRDL
jgi:hypothetical protein